jgi:LysM repeat protein
MHVVESGDTLFGIALDYGVTLDALLAANGIGADAILSIGQQIIIPTEEQGAPVETTGMVAPVENLILPTPTPLPLDVRGVAYYRTAVGGGWCMGEVVNTTDGPITNLQVEVSVANGEILLLSGVTRAAADYLPAGARAPFALLFQEAPGGDVSVEARLLRAEPIGAITAGFKPLAVSETTGGVSGPQYRVGGRLTNDAGVALDRVTVVVTLYDEEGRVLGYREEPVREGGGVASDESLSFEILLTPQGVGNPDSFSVLAWGSQL